jgi:hypothetical protein
LMSGLGLLQLQRLGGEGVCSSYGSSILHSVDQTCCLITSFLR